MLSKSFDTVLLLDAGAGGAVGVVGTAGAGVVEGGSKGELGINVMLLKVEFSSSQPGSVMFSGILIIGDSVMSSSVSVVFRAGGKTALFSVLVVVWLEITDGVLMLSGWKETGSSGGLALSTDVAFIC